MGCFSYRIFDFFCHGQLLFFGHIQMERIIGTLHQAMTQSATHFTRFRRRLIGKRKNQTHPCYCQYPCNDPIKLFFHAILLLFTGFYPLKPLSPSESGYHMPRHKKLHLCRDIRIPVQYPAQFRHREYNFRSE